MTKQYRYGMRLRGFAPLCQPMDGLDHREYDPKGKYYDILVYNRKLDKTETEMYSLDQLDEENEIKMKTYYVTFVVDGRYVAKVETEEGKSIDEIKELAVENYCDADFGQLEDIDGYPSIVEDENGNYLWERGY